MAIRGYSWALGCSRSPLQHGTAQGKLSSPGQEFTSPKKEAELFQVSSLELVWQRCFFLNYTIMHMQCGHRSNCCPETLTLAFSYFPGLSPRCVCVGVCLLMSRSIYSISQSRGGKVIPAQSTQYSFCIHKYLWYLLYRDYSVIFILFYFIKFWTA